MAGPLRFEYRLTEEILQRGLRRVPVRRTLTHALILAGFGIACLAGLLLLEGPIEGFLLGFSIFCLSLIGVLDVLLLLIAFQQWRGREQLRQWASERLDQTIRWSLADESFTVETPERSREVIWADVIRFAEESDFWVLAVRKGPELMLPVECLTREIRTLIRSRAVRERKKEG